MSIKSDSIPARKEWLAVAGITVVALALRLYRIDHQSLWYDESFSVLASLASLPDLMQQLIQDFVHPPLHYVVLHALGHAFGMSSYTARATSAVLGTLSVPLLFFAGTILFNRTTGLLAAVLLAISQLAVMYSQEARPYAQEMFFVAALLVFLGLALRHRISWAWWCAVLTATLAVYTHYFSVFAVAPLFIWAAFGKDRVGAGKIVGGLLIAVVLFLPWIFSGVYESAITSAKTTGEQPSWFSVSWTTIFDTLNRFNNGGIDGVLTSGPPWAFFVGALLFTAPAMTSTSGRRTSGQALVWAAGMSLVVLLSAATGAWKSGTAVALLFAARAVLASCKTLALSGSSVFRLAASPKVWAGLLVLAFLVCLHQDAPRWILFTLGLMLGVIAHGELLGKEAPDQTAARSWRVTLARAEMPALFLLASFCLGVAVPIALGFIGFPFDSRYTLSALPIYYVLVAQGIARITPHTFRYAWALAACAFSLFALRANYFFPYKENWRDSMALVVDSYQANDCVTMAPFGNRPVNTWYAYGFDKKLPGMRYLPVSRVAEDVAGCPRLWFMEYRRVRVAFEAAESLRREVEKHHKVVAAWSFHWIDVYLYAARNSTSDR